jgi:hypothetical protein
MSASEARDAALARLSASRERLARALLPLPPAGGTPDAAASWALPRRWRAQWRLWARRSPLAPLLDVARQGLAGWWQRQPWRDTAGVAAELGAARLRPWVRQHPWAAIALGAAAGSVVAAARPWRWRAWRVHAKRSTRWALGWALGQLGTPALQWLAAGLAVGHAPEPAAAQAVEPPA